MLAAHTPAWLLAVSALALWPRAPFDAYEPIKLGLVTVLLGIAAWHGARWPGSARQRLTALLLLLLGLLPAALLTPDSQQFWLGSPQRSQGALAVLLCLAAGWLAAGSGTSGRSSLLLGAVWTTLLMAILALLQRAGFDPLLTGASRPGGTLGNPLLLGQWLGLTLPLCVLAARRSTWPRLAWLAGVLGALALLASGARSTVLALGLVGGFYGLWRLPLASTRRALLALLACAAASLLLAWVISLRPASLEHRLLLWQGATSALLAPPSTLGPQALPDPWHAWRPLTGYGADLEVLPLRERAVLSLSRHGADPDRAHQWLLDLLLRYGIAGVLAGALGVLWCCRRLRPDSTADPTFTRHAWLALSAWLLSLQSGFALTADSMAAALLVGMCCAPMAPLPVVAGSGWTGRLSGGLLILIAMACWLLPPGWVAGSAWRRAESALLQFDQARTLLAQAAPPPLGCAAARLAEVALQKAATLDPWRPEYASFHSATEAALASNCQRSSQKQ